MSSEGTTDRLNWLRQRGACQPARRNWIRAIKTHIQTTTEDHQCSQGKTIRTNKQLVLSNVLVHNLERARASE